MTDETNNPTPASGPVDADDRLSALLDDTITLARNGIKVTRGPMGSFYRTESSAEELYQACGLLDQALALLTSGEASALQSIARETGK